MVAQNIIQPSDIEGEHLSQKLVRSSVARKLHIHYEASLPSSRHVEMVVSLSHNNADSHIHVNIDFGEGDGKIPVDKIAQKAELR